MTLCNLNIRGARTPTSALTVQVLDSFEGRRLGFIEILRHDPMSNEPIVQVSAVGPLYHNASVSLSDCWFMGNEGEGYAAVLSTPRTGRAFIKRLLIKRCAFLGNRTNVGVDPWFTREVSIENVYVLEKHVDAWLRLRSPLVNVGMSDSSLSSAGKLVEFLTGPYVARAHFLPVAAIGCRLLSASAPSPEDFPGAGNSYGAAVSGFDWRDAIGLTERPPDREGLEAVFPKQVGEGARYGQN